MMNPPIPTSSPVSTFIRVERFNACTGPCVGVGLGPPEVAVGVGVGGVPVGVGVGVPANVEVGVGVGLPHTPAIAKVSIPM